MCKYQIEARLGGVSLHKMFSQLEDQKSLVIEADTSEEACQRAKSYLSRKCNLKPFTVQFKGQAPVEAYAFDLEVRKIH